MFNFKHLNTQNSKHKDIKIKKEEVHCMSKDSKTVFIGRKPTMDYVLAVMSHFNSSDSNECVIKARGRAISTAVDVAEIVNKRFLKDLNVEDVKIGTEELQQAEGGTRNVSSIEITMLRK